MNPAVDWRARALCREVDPEIFYAVHGGRVESRHRIAAAKQVCADCPVRSACLEWALAEDDRFGVLGGMTPQERKPLIARRAGVRVAEVLVAAS